MNRFITIGIFGKDALAFAIPIRIQKALPNKGNGAQKRSGIFFSAPPTGCIFNHLGHIVRKHFGYLTQLNQPGTALENAPFWRYMGRGESQSMQFFQTFFVGVKQVSAFEIGPHIRIPVGLEGCIFLYRFHIQPAFDETGINMFAIHVNNGGLFGNLYFCSDSGDDAVAHNNRSVFDGFARCSIDGCIG